MVNRRWNCKHSRSSSGQRTTDINALCDEYLRLSYHGLRAKDDKLSMQKFETDLIDHFQNKCELPCRKLKGDFEFNQ